MAERMEAVRQRVQQEAANELVRVERHHLCPSAMTIIPPAERDAFVLRADQPGISDGDAMGVATEVGQHLPWTAERRFGVDHPVETARPGQQAGEGGWLGQAGSVAEELEAVRVEGGS